MIGLQRGIVALYDHETEWVVNAAQTIEKLKRIFGSVATEIRHIGSTAIGQIKAKPIIDIVVAVHDFAEVINLVPLLEAEGFLYRPNGNLENQLLFACGDYEHKDGKQTHFIHVVKKNSMEYLNYINFCNYLNAKPTIAKQYESLKISLAETCKNDPGRERYLQGKADFISYTLRKALVWSYLGKTVPITIDRPIGCVHPKHSEIIYPINYGYIEGVFGGDGEELDVYLLGIDKPLVTFTGRVIAIVHRENDVEDKLVAAPIGVCYSAEEISQAVAFQEQFYISHVEVFSPKVIHILGAAGSGTTTLGKAISEQYGFTHLDTDDFFWMPTNPRFTVKRNRSERQEMLAKAIEKSEKCVISGSLCGWGDQFIPTFELVLYVDTPTDIRMERLNKRESERFGARILPDGDMYNQHVAFLEWARSYDTGDLDMRSFAMHMDWLKKIPCAIIRIDGTEPLEPMLRKVGL